MMIQFPCRCGNLFRLEPDEAGNSVQCPACGLLTDVPLLGELHTLQDDGTYKLEEPSALPQSSGERLSDLAQSFGKAREAVDGTQIDMRLTPEEIAAVGVPAPTKVSPPRYDPETGELILPLELNEPARHAKSNAKIPFARPAVTYSTIAPLPSDSWLGTVKVLSAPVNIVVMTTVLAVQLFASIGFVFSIASGLMIATFGAFIIQLMLIAHFGNVIEEAGVEERDDLPRLFRDLQLYEDIWSPLTGFLGATLICYAPALVCLMSTFLERSTFLTLSDVLLALAWVIGICIVMISALSEGIARIDWTEQVVLPLAGILLATIVSFAPAGLCLAVDAGSSVRLTIASGIALVGTFLVPGVLLTMMTSGTILNLRPDRLLKTIGLCGARYISPMLAWAVAAIAYGLGQTILAASVTKWVTGTGTGTWLDHALLGYPLICIALIVMHYFCFELGMLYRKHHAAFPWVLQRHEPVNQKRRSAAIRTATRSRLNRVLPK